MSHQNASHSVTEIYKSVVNDVIAQVREAFLDENVDVDILQQLKKEWEDKVNASGCVDWEKDAYNRPQNVAPPAMRPASGMIPQRINTSAPPQRIQNQPQGLPVHGHPSQMNQMHVEQRTVQPQVQYVQQQSLPQPHIQVPMGVFTNAGGMRMVQPQQHGQFLIQGQPQMVFVQNAGGSGQPVTLAMGPNGAMLQTRTLQPGQIPQLDGTGECEEEQPNEEPESAVSSSSSRRGKPSRAEALKVLHKLLEAVQLDGGGGGMSDSSSEDEEENDPLSRLADRIGGNGEIEDGEDQVEEDPLNSEDDQSDDEDLTTLFDADNVIMCQFEKVNRARNKWKFQLKDGIMHINDKDYCFQRCIGEAEW